MAEHKPLVIIAGIAQQVPTGDGLALDTNAKLAFGSDSYVHYTGTALEIIVAQEDKN